MSYGNYHSGAIEGGFGEDLAERGGYGSGCVSKCRGLVRGL